MTLSDRYGVRSPTEAEAVDSLADLVGPAVAEGVWRLVRRELDLEGPIEDPADMRRMAEQLMTLGDLLRVAGRSTKIRVTTFEAMSRTDT